MTITVEETTTATLTNNCICLYCQECGLLYQSDESECVECSGELEYECYGCYEDMLSDVQENIVDPWVKANPASTYDFAYRNMGWRRLNGTSSVNAENIVSNFTGLRTDWTMVWSVTDQGELQCIRYHHDAPTGETFTFSTQK